MYETIEEARKAVADGLADFAADCGDDAAADYGAYDIVMSVAQFCTPSVAAELKRIELGIV